MDAKKEMDAKTRAYVLDSVADRVKNGEDVFDALSDFFSAGYDYDIEQSHYDCDTENIGSKRIE